MVKCTDAERSQGRSAFGTRDTSASVGGEMAKPRKEEKKTTIWLIVELNAFGTTDVRHPWSMRGEAC
jgi:hypothetical protein